jgi:hypothetical protein
MRLLKIETERVKETVDNPTRITEAELLRARSELWAAVLDTSAKHFRNLLSELTGLSDSAIDPDLNSIPLLPAVPLHNLETQARVKQSAAVRDIIQLEYFLANTKRKSVRGKMVVGKANISGLIEAYINEFQKFNELIEVNFELQLARLNVLKSPNQFRQWLSSDPRSQTELKTQTALTPSSTSLRARHTIDYDHTRNPLSCRPQPQQFSAVAIYNDNTTKDNTLEAEWKSFSDWTTIVSSTGLVTGLDASEVTISATVLGVTQTRHILTTPEQLESF